VVKSAAVSNMAHKAKKALSDAYANLYWRSKSANFVSVYEEDWDNLIILDACRYDIFEEEYLGPGQLQMKYSKAPYSPAFFQKNFAEKKCHDLVSITANPHHRLQLDDTQFHSVYHLWKTHWNDEIKNVHPEAVKQVSTTANASHPQKRLMIHFMQPHAPFIGPWGQENIGIHVGNEHCRQDAMHGSYDVEITDPYSLAAQGEVKRSELERAYRENLNIALESVRELLSLLDGRTVVTADHGELFGERAWPYVSKQYQHPPILAEKLLQIPWLVIPSETRRNVTTEEPDGPRDETDVHVEQRLKHLGYT
jgi:hypothetical protein